MATHHTLLELLAKPERAELLRVIELALVHDPELEDILIAHLEAAFDEELEDFIDMHVLVDCYDEYEEASSWRAFLDKSLCFPFEAVWWADAASSEILTAIRLEDEEDRDGSVFVEARSCGGALRSVPLEELELLEPDSEREHALRAWKYWSRG